VRAECHKVVTKSILHVPFSAPRESIETPPRSSLSRETP
jgi:hypothetical protein